MNRFFFLAVFSLLISEALAQKTAEEFLAAIPDLTFDPCTADYSQKREFEEEILVLGNSVRAELEARQQESEQFHKEHQDEEKINVLMKLGYTREQADKLKNTDQMSEEEQMAIADEMLMNRKNMNMEDYKKVAEYDTAAQRRWAQANSTMQMADMDAGKNEKEQLNLKQDFDLQAELKFQIDKVRAGEDKYLQQIGMLDKEADTAGRLMDKKIEKAQKDLENCTNDQQRDQIEGHMAQLRYTFCKQFTPKYLEIIGQFKVYIQQNLNEYNKLEELQIKSAELQTGVKNPNYKSGSMSIGIVDSYIRLLSNAFKYNMNNNLGIPVFD
jgi:hypothetical protein